jgi:hypothetical protein
VTCQTSDGSAGATAALPLAAHKTRGIQSAGLAAVASATNSGVARVMARGPHIGNFSLQIDASAGTLRIRVRRFDSSRGHSL